MEPRRGDDAARRATRIYAWVVRLYPAEHQRRFGEQMAQTFADHYRDVWSSGEESAARFWLGVLGDEAKALPRARLAALLGSAHGWAVPRLRSFWYLYLLALLLPVVATLYGQRHEIAYVSTARLYVQPNSVLKDFQPQVGNPFATKAQNVSDQLAQLLQSQSFLVGVARDTSLKSIYDLASPAGQDAADTRLRGNIAVSATSKTVVAVSASDQDSPQVAKEVAGAVITEFVAFYAAQEVDTLNAAKSFYDQQLTDNSAKVADDLKALNDYVQRHPEVQTFIGQNDPKYVQLKGQADADQATLTSTESNANEVTAALAAARGGRSNEVTPVDTPTLPLTTTVNVARVLVYLALALLAALVLFALTGVSYRPRVASR